MNKILLLATTLCLLAPGEGAVRAQDEPQAQPLRDADFIDFEPELRKLVQLYDAPSLSVAVIKDGKIIYAKAFGFSDLSDQSPATVKTQYAIGSVVKTFTSGLIGQLEQEGLIDLDAPVTDYLNQLQLGSVDAAENMTVAHLLSQTSGLPNLDGSLTFFPARNQIDVASRIGQFPMSCRVGDCWQYNNLNFVLLDAIAEQVSGHSKSDLIRERLFERAGMLDSLSSTAAFEASGNSASGYAQVNGEARSTAIEYLYGEQVYATASDMARWLDLWMNEGGSVIPAPYIRQAISMQAISDGSPPTANDPGAYLSGYGYGWRIRSRGGHYQVEHGGNENGFSTQVLFVPAQKVGVVAMTNQQNSILPYIANDIALRHMLDQEKVPLSNYPVEVQSATALLDEDGVQLQINRQAPPSLDPYLLTGRYTAPGYGEVTIAYSDGVLALSTPAAEFILTHREGDRYSLNSAAPLPMGINTAFFEIEFQENALTANIASPPVQFRKSGQEEQTGFRP